MSPSMLIRGRYACAFAGSTIRNSSMPGMTHLKQPVLPGIEVPAVIGLIDSVAIMPLHTQSCMWLGSCASNKLRRFAFVHLVDYGIGRRGLFCLLWTSWTVIKSRCNEVKSWCSSGSFPGQGIGFTSHASLPGNHRFHELPFLVSHVALITSAITSVIFPKRCHLLTRRQRDVYQGEP